MKLIFCKDCQDVIKIDRDMRTCKCGKAKAYLTDHINAIVNDHAIVLGFSNPSLANAFKIKPTIHFGSRFEAFIISKEAKSIKVDDTI